MRKLYVKNMLTVPKRLVTPDEMLRGLITFNPFNIPLVAMDILDIP